MRAELRFAMLVSQYFEEKRAPTAKPGSASRSVTGSTLSD
jgi:hypothetical protein